MSVKKRIQVFIYSIQSPGALFKVLFRFGLHNCMKNCDFKARNILIVGT